MAATLRKRSKTPNVKQTNVDQAMTFLEDLPEKPKEDLSLKEAVDRLRVSLQAALAKGYTYEDLSAMLTQKGIQISASTLKNYVPSGRRQSSGKTPRTRRPRKAQNGETASLPTAPEPEAVVAIEALAAPEAETTEAQPRRRRTATAAKTTRGPKAKTAANSTGPKTPGRRGRKKAEPSES